MKVNMVKKNISIEETLKNLAVEKAKKQRMTFSAYVTHLILKDLGEIATTEDKPAINDKVRDAMNGILGM